MLVKRALEAAAPEIKTLSDDSGLNYGTLRAWRAGLRSPSAENREKIAALLDRRADLLRGLAEELRRSLSR
jgi:transcriptional regulator with XRE-family HTH domain